MDRFGWLEVIWMNWISNFWRRSRRGGALDRLPICRLEAFEMGRPSACWVRFGLASSLLAGHGQDRMAVGQLEMIWMS